MGRTMAWPWGRGDRHHLGTGRPWWLCHYYALGPWFALLHFFCSYRASKAGVPLGRAPQDGGVSPGTSSEDVGGSSQGRGPSQRWLLLGGCGDMHLTPS